MYLITGVLVLENIQLAHEIGAQVSQEKIGAEIRRAGCIECSMGCYSNLVNISVLKTVSKILCQINCVT